MKGQIIPTSSYIYSLKWHFTTLKEILHHLNLLEVLILCPSPIDSHTKVHSFNR